MMMMMMMMLMMLVVVMTTVASFNRSVHLWFIAGVCKFRVGPGVYLYGDARYLSVFLRKFLHETLLAP
jgi:hypothetical protein